MITYITYYLNILFLKEIVIMSINLEYCSQNKEKRT